MTTTWDGREKENLIFSPLLPTFYEWHKRYKTHTNYIHTYVVFFEVDSNSIGDNLGCSNLPVGVSFPSCTPPLYSRHVWCRPRPQGEPWVNVHSFLLDLKRSLFFLFFFFFFSCTRSFRDEQEAFRDQNCVYQGDSSGKLPLMPTSWCLVSSRERHESDERLEIRADLRPTFSPD